MRRILTVLALCLTVTPWLVAQQPAAASKAGKPAPAVAMLTVDGIMRGPKLVGAPPTAVRWSKDSSKIYFSWQKAGEERASNYVVNKDGSALRLLNPGETADVPVAAGRFDRAHRRTLSADNG